MAHPHVEPVFVSHEKAQGTYAVGMSTSGMHFIIEWVDPIDQHVESIYLHRYVVAAIIEALGTVADRSKLHAQADVIVSNALNPDP